MKGIMIASFGSSFETGAIETVKREVEENFKGFSVKEGYSPNMMKRLEGDKKKADYTEAFNDLKSKCDEVYILSLFMTSGIEYNKVKNLGGILTEPLLSDKSYYPEILKGFEIKKREGLATLIVGHGTHHSADIEYEDFYNSIDNRDVFYCTLEGGKTFEDVRKKLENYDEVRIIPLFLVAGDHVNNDIFHKENSIAATLSQTLKVSGEGKGLLEFKGIREIFIKKLKLITEA